MSQSLQTCRHVPHHSVKISDNESQVRVPFFYYIRKYAFTTSTNINKKTIYQTLFEKNIKNVFDTVKAHLILQIVNNLIVINLISDYPIPCPPICPPPVHPFVYLKYFHSCLDSCTFRPIFKRKSLAFRPKRTLNIKHKLL